MDIIDLSKDFDHIPRELLYSLLEKGGFPNRILEPYAQFQEHVNIVFAIGYHAGEVHTRDRSIPQGDPWSMMEMAFLMRPWIMLMRSMGLKPRNLADDMFLASEGPNLAEKVHEGVAAAHHMVEDMDSEVNIDKSALMANTPHTSTALKQYLWGLRE